MRRDRELELAINRLWEPVYPHMASFVRERAGTSPRMLVDVGPFAGGIGVELLALCPGASLLIVDGAAWTLEWSLALASRRGVSGRVGTVMGGLDALPMKDRLADVVTVRGAFFFLDPPLLRDVARVLGAGGFGWVGGGYGPFTPDSVLGPIADESRRLNAALGKRWIGRNEAKGLVTRAGLEKVTKISERGGLWLELAG